VLCTYMGGEKSDGNPFRFFWNKSRATAANVYLLLYPKGELNAALAARPDLYPIVFAHLQSLTGEHLIKEGRVYGGGLHKMEPKDLAHRPAHAPSRIAQVRPPPKQRPRAFGRRASGCADGPGDESSDRADEGVAVRSWRKAGRQTGGIWEVNLSGGRGRFPPGRRA